MGMDEITKMMEVEDGGPTLDQVDEKGNVKDEAASGGDEAQGGDGSEPGAGEKAESKSISPEQKEEKSAEGDAPEQGEQAAAPDEDLVEVEGERYFYHPSVHAKGEKTHPNSYKSVDDARVAAMAKLDMMREHIGQLREHKAGVKSLGLPGFLKDPSALDELTEDAFFEMDADSLRSSLKEMDQFNQRADDKISRITGGSESPEISPEFQKNLDTAQQAAQQALQELNLDPNELATRFQDLDSLLKHIDSDVVSQRVEAQLADDIAELEAFEADEDKFYELGQKAFSKEVRTRTAAIEQKRQQLASDLRKKAGSIREFVELSKKQPAAKKAGISEAEKLKARKASRDEFVEDMKALDAKFANPDYTRAFTAFATRRASEFNDLQSVDDWVDAQAAWESFKGEQRAKQRAGQAGTATKGRAASDGLEEVKKPNPAEQEDMRRYGRLRHHDVDKQIAELENS